jgi:hypothetical protein
MLTEAEWTPFQTHCYTENLVAMGSEPKTSELAVRTPTKNILDINYETELL